MPAQSSAPKSLPWDHPNPFIWKISCAGEHEDRLGHINNVQYLHWLEEAGWQHISQLGSPWHLWQKENAAMATIETRVKYLAAAKAGDFLKIGTWLTSCDRLRLTRQFQIIRVLDGRTLLRAEKDYVCITLSTGKPRPMPESMYEAHQKGVALVSP